MKKIILRNMSVVYRLSNKESQKLLRSSKLEFVKEEKIKDVVYGGRDDIYKLFSLDGKYLFDIGGIYYLSKDIADFEYIVSKTINFEKVYHYRFLSEDKIKELFSDSNIEKSKSSFQLRNNLNTKKITSKDIKDEILRLQEKSFDYDWEYLSIIIGNNKNKYSELKIYNLEVAMNGLIFVMVDSIGNEFSPVDSLVIIFEATEIYSY